MKLFTTMIFLLTLPFLSHAGVEISGGGGNGHVGEFRHIGRNALKLLEQKGVSRVLNLSLEPRFMLTKFNETRITSTREALFVDGQRVHAINYPSTNSVVFNELDWRGLRYAQKQRLVLHEVIRLAYGTDQDKGYMYSDEMVATLKTFTVEDVALTMARSGSAQPNRVKIQSKRTHRESYKTMPEVDGTMEGYVYTIYVQTFENSSPEAVRIYRIWEDETGAVVKTEIVGGEGPIGP